MRPTANDFVFLDGQIVQITGVERQPDGSFLYSTHSRVAIKENEIIQIPLTEAILDENGLYNDGHDCYHFRVRPAGANRHDLVEKVLNKSNLCETVTEFQYLLRICKMADKADNLRFPAQMQEMVYTTERQFDVLHSGIYSGYEFFIVSYGTHPCFYIAFPDGHRYGSMNITAIESSPVLERGHGGLSFRGTISALSANKYLLGWDYNHAGDYNPLLCLSGRKYSVQEILDDVRRMIDLICREDSEVSSNFI